MNAQARGSVPRGRAVGCSGYKLQLLSPSPAGSGTPEVTSLTLGFPFAIHLTGLSWRVNAKGMFFEMDKVPTHERVTKLHLLYSVLQIQCSLI